MIDPRGARPAFPTMPAIAAFAAVAIFFASSLPATAAEGLDGAKLPWQLGLPFVGILMSIALGPLVVKEWWHIHYEKAAAFWACFRLSSASSPSKASM